MDKDSTKRDSYDIDRDEAVLLDEMQAQSGEVRVVRLVHRLRLVWNY